MKRFDCVEMKQQIQAEMLSERRRLGEDKARERQWKRVLDDPILGKRARERSVEDGAAP